MKKTYILFILGLLFTACFKPEEVPVVRFNGTANMTIAKFQKLHTLNPDSLTLIKDDIIITGIVTSTDKFGHCYKELFIQDETGGISIRISNTSYYNKYRIGQRVFVKAKDLYLGNYVSGTRYGFYQIGWSYGKGLGYLSFKSEGEHIFLSGVPETPPAPKVINSTNDIVREDYHTLVKLTNCYFTEANGEKKFYEPGNYSTLSRTIQLNNGGIVEARISKEFAAANSILPEGKLDITGLLTMFGTSASPTPQLTIRSINDVDIKTLRSYNMKTNPFSEGWNNQNIKGNEEWKYNASFRNVTIQASTETECLLTSPTFNFPSAKNVALFLKYRLLNGTKDNFEILYSLNDGATWTPFDFTPITGNIIDGVIQLDNNMISKSFRIAFKYKTTNTYPAIQIQNIAFVANAY